MERSTKGPLEQSLDEIIRNKRRNRPRPNGTKQPQMKQMRGPNTKQFKKPINDARNKIILKKRTQITDAREKLAELAKQRDARDKLEQLRMKKRGIAGNFNRSNITGGFHKNRNVPFNIRNNSKFADRGIFSDATRQVHPSPLMLSPQISRGIQMSPIMPMSGYPMDISMEEEYVPAPLKPIIRVVDNDISHYHLPPPSFHQLSRSYKRPLKDKLVMKDDRGLNFKVVTKNDDVRTYHHVEVPKRSFRSDEPIYIRDDSPPSPVSILKKRPVGGKPVTISAKSRIQQHPARPPSPLADGFRILVSNLQNNVTAGDIHELFGDIGELVESRLVRPGTAEVIYDTLEDAQKAVDVYHNRQLDGQPMKCFLVNPRTTDSNKPGPGRSGKHILPASSNSSVVPDISTFHKVLFRKH